VLDSVQSGVLQVRLRSQGLAVRSDGVLLDSGKLSSEFDALVEALKPFQNQRIALASPRAEHILIALAAGEAVGCEVLLLRTEALAPERAQAWKISAVIDPALDVVVQGLPVNQNLLATPFKLSWAASGERSRRRRRRAGC